tara:strand:+ start:49 stop:366 length:318 start_codon:yes stop_codon:yes gene_type:complete
MAGNSRPKAATGSLEFTAIRGAMGGGSPRTLYYAASIGAASNLSSGDTLYTDAALTTKEGETFNAQWGSSATTTACVETYQQWVFDTDSNGQIYQNIFCQGSPPY